MISNLLVFSDMPVMNPVDSAMTPHDEQVPEAFVGRGSDEGAGGGHGDKADHEDHETMHDGRDYDHYHDQLAGEFGDAIRQSLDPGMSGRA